MNERKYLIPFGENQSLHTQEYLIGMIEDAHYTTRSRLNNISQEELDWQYAEGWNSVGALLAHIISVRKYMEVIWIEERDFTLEEEMKYLSGLELGGNLPKLKEKSLSDYISEMEYTKKTLIEKIKAISLDEFHKKRKGYSEENGCNLAWVLYHMAEDEVHHRGQISIIRKLYSHLYSS